MIYVRESRRLCPRLSKPRLCPALPDRDHRRGAGSQALPPRAALKFQFRPLPFMYGPSARLRTFLTGLLAPATVARYEAGLALFDEWAIQLHLDWRQLPEEGLDYALCDFILDGREADHQRQKYVDAVAAVQKAFGNRRRVSAAAKVLDGWLKDEPPQQAPPVPRRVAFAIVALLHLVGTAGSAFALLLCFCGLLRIGEALQLMGADLVFTQDGGEVKLVILLRRTKRAANDSEKVVICNARVVRYAFLFVRFRAALPHERLVTSTYVTVSSDLCKACGVLGLSVEGFTTHSFRRGGASALSLAGMPLNDVMLFGRWLSERSATLYIKKGEVLVLRLEASPSPDQLRRISWLASLGEQVFAVSSDAVRRRPIPRAAWALGL